MNESPLGFSTRLLSYLAAVLLPTFVVLVYQGLVASDGYVSQVEIMVEQENALPSPELALGLLSLGSAPSKVDALVVQTFLESRTMLEYLDNEMDLFGHFSSPEVDPWNRLASDASREDFLEHFRDQLDVQVDDESYVMTIEFIAHDSNYAHRVLQHLVARSEQFVNDISQFLAREQLSFVQREVDRAKDELKQASRRMAELQRDNRVFSPEKETEVSGTVIAGLMQELAKERTQLKALNSYLNAGASEVVASRQQISALEEQIAQERSKLVGVDQQGLNDLLIAYQDAEVDLTVATEVYKGAVGTLESTRLDTSRKVKFLVPISEPSLPSSAEHPWVFYWGLTVFLVLNLVYFVFSLILATIKDHRE